MTHPRYALLALTVLLSVASSACSSCRRKEEAPADTRAPDHLAPGEVVESREHAYGLPLPRASRVNARFEKTTHVYTPLTAEELVNFVRARVKDGKVTPGATSTQLLDVAPLHEPARRLTIDVRTFRSGEGFHSEMVVRDSTPPPLEPGLTDEQRWKKAGLTPSGEIADPTKLQ